MPSTYCSLYFHIVFGTKDRLSSIELAWQDRLHDYLGGTIRGLGGHAQRVGGMPDHVHIAIGMGAGMCLASIVREVKKASSVWIHTEIGRKLFAWQEGYAAFTVSASALPKVTNYIANQPRHHLRQTYQEELTTILAKAGISYEPR